MRVDELPHRGPVQPYPITWPRQPARGTSLVAIVRKMFLVITLMYFVFSPSMLFVTGWHYLGGGFEIEKIHLATYLLIPAFAFLLFSDYQFQARALPTMLDPLFYLFALVSGVIAVYSIVFKHVSIAPFIDTFLAAILVTTGLIAMPRQNMRTLRWILDLFFMAGIAILFYEYFYTTRILPTPTGEAAMIEQFFRAAAIFEGPLSAATLVGVYALVNLISTPIRFSGRCIFRLFLSFLAFAAIFTTGGRTALIGVALMAPLYVFTSAFLQAGSGKINIAALIYIIIGIPTLLLMLLVLWQYGVFDTMLARFDYDIGSAFSRQVAVDIALNMPAGDLLTGMSAADLSAFEARQINMGLVAIEISWVNFIMVCGLPLTIALFITFLLFLFKFLPKICGIKVMFPALFLLMNVSASNGIWSKTTILTTSVALILAFLRKDLTKA